MRRLVLLAPLIALPAAAAPPAVIADPLHDAAHPAWSQTLSIPTGGVTVNGLAYVARGWPGNEKNLDLAQAVRRAGWNAVTFNYRGSWGSRGAFRFAHVPEDTAAVIAWLRTPEVAKRLRSIRRASRWRGTAWVAGRRR